MLSKASCLGLCGTSDTDSTREGTLAFLQPQTPNPDIINIILYCLYIYKYINYPRP